MPTIDIPDNDPRRQQVNASGGQTVFNYNFILLDEGDLVVIQEGTTLVLNTDYTVTGVGNESGGTFVLASGATAGDLVTYYGQTAIGRASQYQVDGRFDAPPLERDLDRITVILQEQSRDIERTVKLNVEDTNTSLELPAASANKALKWNSAGTKLQNSLYDPDAAEAAAVAAAASAGSASSSASTATTQAGLANTARIAAELAETNAAASALAAQVAKIEWRGAWSAGTYQINDAVERNGSSWIATAVTTEEPSLSATDWDLVALKGVDGTGAGDVEGPASSTDGAVALFDGIDGKLLRDGVILGALAEEDDAAGVPYDNTLSGLTATDVQAAIDEIAGGSSGGGVLDHQALTTSGTWTKPSGLAGTESVRLRLWGGGGGGHNSATDGGGGGGGGFLEYWTIASALGGTEDYVIGAGGAVSTAGGTTSFGTTPFLWAGGGGTSLNAAAGGGGGGAGSTISSACSGGNSTASQGGGGGGGGNFGNGGNNSASTGGAGGAGGTFLGGASGGTGGSVAAGTGNDGLYGGGGGQGGSSSTGTGIAGNSVYGGGGGGGATDSTNGSRGGDTIWGGAGGAGGDADGGLRGGISTYGGNGGNTGVAGSAPAGGGGRNAAGARGEIHVTVFGGGNLETSGY